jgi:hypothetical protein
MITPIAEGMKVGYTLFNAVTTNSTSDIASPERGRRVIKASIAGIGAISATVTWYGNDVSSTTNSIVLATSTLSGTTSDVSGADIPAQWPYMYAVISSITGTSAAVTAKITV